VTAAQAWRPLPPRRRSLDAGDLVEIDFGREVTGYLHLDVAPRAPAEGIAFFAAGAGASLDRAPDRLIVAVPGLGFWQDVELRRFRYVTLVGLESLQRVAVIPASDAAYAAATPQERPRGLLGGAVEPARSPLEEALRRRLLEVSEAGR